MPIDLVALCGVDLQLGAALVVGDGPSGTRIVAPVVGMTLRGDRLEATIVGEGADWLTITGGVATIDVRATVRTGDGALIYVQYSGRSDATRGMGSEPVYVAPRFETGDERYRWLNAVQAIGKGLLSELHYDWYEVR